MAFFDTAFAQAKAWTAASGLTSANESDRKRAMQTLRDLGLVSLPVLRATVRRTGAPGAQYAAAVVLHWLGDQSGLPVLVDALRWQLPSEPQIVRELEAALIAIGAPDAVDALMRTWKQLPPNKDNRRALKTVCRVWCALGDPRPLALLVEAADQIPDLFEETVPRFQAHALPFLACLAQAETSARRSLAVRTLRHIEGGQGAPLMVPLLCDADPAVRALCAEALYKMQKQGYLPPHAAILHIQRAVRQGYSAPQSVRILLTHHTPEIRQTLLQLALRWRSPAENPGDTLEAVLEAIPCLAHPALFTPSARAEFTLQLCGVLERRPEPPLMAAVARVLAQSGVGEAQATDHARSVLFGLLSHPDGETRTEAANALAALNDLAGTQLLQALGEAWPQGNWRDKLQSLLRDGSDATQFANQAVQWFTRVSKETVERFTAPSRLPDVSALADTRLPGLLRTLLANALSALGQTSSPDKTESMLDLAVACIRALVRLGADATRAAQSELLLALHLCKAGPYRALYRPSPTSEDVMFHDWAEGVRMAAGQALVAVHGANSFPLFLECLYAPQIAIRATGIDFLGELGDVRALSHLQANAIQGDPALSIRAGEAIARIRHLHPETMTLLRASSAVDSRPDTLLRPASGNTDGDAADILLRPTATKHVTVTHARDGKERSKGQQQT